MRSGSKARGGEGCGRGVRLAEIRLGVRTAIGIAAICGVLSLSAQPVCAELSGGAQADESSFWKGVGLGAGAAVANLAYMPAKMVYALVGGTVGGLAYLVTLGSTETANAIWEPTLGGTYVLTPEMLAGKERLHFNGEPPMPVEPVYRGHDGGWSQ